MGSISKFCERMRYWCDDGNLGYDQSQRWNIWEGGECDCSSLVIFALREAGFDTGDASYTGDMSDELTARGWRRLPADISNCRAGDILLNDVHHVCAVIDGSGWGATIAQASIDERGAASGGQSGDQTGGETVTKPVYTYWAGWDCILRYGGSDEPTDGRLDVDGVLGRLSVSEWQRQCGTTVDGVVSGQDESLARWYPALDAVQFGGGGSELMWAVQSKVGVTPQTGVVGRETMMALQLWLHRRGYDLGRDVAGVLEQDSAKALQRSLNDGEWADEA